MTNREKYDLNRNSYDKMVDMLETGICPIHLVSERQILPRFLTCKTFDEYCQKCIQDWLNQEAEE